ncbi:TPA: helix-turn-helix domain-containing protein [Providencia stuartii]
METTELIDLLSRGEDSRQQFKTDINNADALAAEIVAFSNTAGGRIFIGVNDDGSVRGLSSADVARLNMLIANVASQVVRPAVNPLTENVPHPAGMVLVLSIAEGVNKPCMDKNGAIWVKNGSDKRRATSREELQRLFQLPLYRADLYDAPQNNFRPIQSRHQTKCAYQRAQLSAL